MAKAIYEICHTWKTHPGDGWRGTSLDTLPVSSHARVGRRLHKWRQHERVHVTYRGRTTLNPVVETVRLYRELRNRLYHLLSDPARLDLGPNRHRQRQHH